MDEARLRIDIAELLRGGSAHLSVGDAIAGLPPELRARRPPGGGHSVFELLEHMRLAQEDLLRYTLEPEWRSPAWPEGYWPARTDAVDDEAWQRSLGDFEADLGHLLALVEDPGLDLTAPLPHGEGRTALRELLLVADHNAYHLGQIVAVRQALGAWPQRKGR